ncbi:MAG: cobalamin-dependent protein [Deltaproteobacteria bacterium]|jgi:MerR family transcriptional regulator, light-induced transcriptional regulator
MKQPPDSPAANRLNPPFAFDEIYRRYLDGLLANDRHQCRVSFEQWLESHAELRTLYEDLVQRSLYEIGDLWERNRISVATEHLATAITESLLNLAYPRLFASPRLGKSAIVACVANEYHQIGGKMIADLFELNGWRGYFLGANTPVRDLKTLIEEKHPDVVALSVAMVFGLDTLISAAAEIRAAFPDVPILVGGQALRWGGRERVERLSGVRCLMSLSELEAWIKDGENHV